MTQWCPPGPSPWCCTIRPVVPSFLHHVSSWPYEGTLKKPGVSFKLKQMNIDLLPPYCCLHTFVAYLTALAWLQRLGHGPSSTLCCFLALLLACLCRGPSAGIKQKDPFLLVIGLLPHIIHPYLQPFLLHLPNVPATQLLLYLLVTGSPPQRWP